MILVFQIANAMSKAIRSEDVIKMEEMNGKTIIHHKNGFNGVDLMNVDFSIKDIVAAMTSDFREYTFYLPIKEDK